MFYEAKVMDEQVAVTEQVGKAGMLGEQNEAALWQCEACGAWWCSQPTIAPTRFMLELDVDALEAMGWDNFRGWRLGGTPTVATCPDCGRIADAPRFGGAPAQPAFATSLEALLSVAVAA